jgi:decaprenylphospho-beta-D-ribofuranose 2-oxidase
MTPAAAAVPDASRAPRAAPGSRWEVLTGWGRATRSRSRLVAADAASDVAAAVAAAGRRGILARGLGRSYGDVAQNAGGDVLDMRSITGIRDLDPGRGVVTAAAGTSLDRLLRVVVPRGWFLPVVPGTRFVTLGGAVANDVHGKNHHRDGSFCDHVTSLRLRTSAGEALQARPDNMHLAFEATAGGVGLTGVIEEVSLRMTPIETSRVLVDTDRAGDLDALLALLEADGDTARYSVAWLDATAGGRRLGRGVLTRAEHASLDVLPPAAKRRPLAYGPRPIVRTPSLLPRLFGPWTAAALNEAWYRASPRIERGRPSDIAPFFFPLDAVEGWNRAYGRRGFVQYQFVVPFGAEATLRAALELLRAARAPSVLAVLKRFGPGRRMLSFPMPGWTLALDLPADRGLASVLRRMDRLVAAAGGRVYLAKDARLDPAMLTQMYPDLERWRAERDRLDPGRTFRSDLDRRLSLADLSTPRGPA